MIRHGVVRSLLLVWAMLSSGSVAGAESPTAKPAAQGAAPAKSTPAAKAPSSADPFEETPAPTKPAVRPVPPAPAKPEATAVAPTAPDAPSKELAAFMKPFEGSWKCETKFAAGSMGPGVQPPAAKTDVTIKKQFDGYSWHGEFKLGKTATTAATSGVFQIGYAASTKQATFLSYDSVGSAMMGAGTLAGDSVTFLEEGFLKGARVKVRETLGAKGPRKMYHKVEIEQGNGFQTMVEDTCSKL